MTRSSGLILKQAQFVVSSIVILALVLFWLFSQSGANNNRWWGFSSSSSSSGISSALSSPRGQQAAASTKSTRQQHQHQQHDIRPCMPFLKGIDKFSECPDDELYLAMWRLHNPQKRKWLVVNVGSNKGYSLVAFADALGVKPFSKSHLGLDIFDYGMKRNVPSKPRLRWSLAGVCCDATESTSVWEDPRIVHETAMKRSKKHQQEDDNMKSSRSIREDPELDVHFLGIDATKTHVDYTTTYFEKYHAQQQALQPRTRFTFQFLQRAVSSHAVLEQHRKQQQQQQPHRLSGERATTHDESAVRVPFPVAELGQETASFNVMWYALFGGGGKTVQMENVTMTTLDNLLADDAPSSSSSSSSGSNHKNSHQNNDHNNVNPAGGSSAVAVIPRDFDHQQAGIDILLTDVEGYDLDVAEGATNWLSVSSSSSSSSSPSVGKVGIYIMELHHGPNKKSLGEFVSELAAAGFRSFLAVDGKNATRPLVEITPSIVVAANILLRSLRWGSRRQQQQRKEKRKKMPMTITVKDKLDFLEKHKKIFAGGGGDDFEGRENCWLKEYDDIARGWKNLVAAGVRHAPELVEVFDKLSTPNYFSSSSNKSTAASGGQLGGSGGGGLQVAGNNKEYSPCTLKKLKDSFFDKHPERHWEWALEAEGVG